MNKNFFGNQEFSSKNTSVNHKKLPYLVKHVDWKQFKGGRCLDFGSGKLNPQTFYEISGMGVQYLPYDPYWLDETTNSKSMSLYPTVVICSNVLCVIKENEVVHGIHNYIRGLKVPYFIKVYEGDKSFISRETKKDCFQRNLPTEEYLYHDEIIYKGIITLPEHKKFII